MLCGLQVSSAPISDLQPPFARPWGLAAAPWPPAAILGALPATAEAATAKGAHPACQCSGHLQGWLDSPIGTSGRARAAQNTIMWQVPTPTGMWLPWSMYSPLAELEGNGPGTVAVARRAPPGSGGTSHLCVVRKPASLPACHGAWEAVADAARACALCSREWDDGTARQRPNLIAGGGIWGVGCGRDMTMDHQEQEEEQAGKV